MAQRTQVVLIDDLDGGEGAETVLFALDGVEYEIDLSAENAATLRDDFSRWVGHGRRTRRQGAAPRAPRARSGSAAGGTGVDTAAVRAWARENGRQVSDRGRVPASLVEEYQAAQG